MSLIKAYEYLLKVHSVPIEDFDEDWEPIGPTLRRELIDDRLAVESNGQIKLHPRLKPEPLPMGTKLDSEFIPRFVRVASRARCVPAGRRSPKKPTKLPKRS